MAITPPRSRHSRLRRLPIRVRLVAGFSIAMLAVLTAAGGFVYWRVQYALDRDLDSELAQATSTITPTFGSGPAGPTIASTSAAQATGTAWQVLDADGHTVARGGAAPEPALVSATELRSVGEGGTAEVVDVGRLLPATARPYRAHLTRLPAGDGYLVVAVRRDHRDEALRELLGQLTLAGLVALLVTALVGDRLARAALTPVERYRRRAAEIAHGATGVRLDVPGDRDDEVTRLGQTLNEMLGALEASMEQQERFVHEASHELRTPLALVKSRLQLARRRPRSLAEHESVLDDLTTDIERLVALTEQLLALGGVPTGATTGAGDHTDVVAVVHRVGARQVPAGEEPDEVRVEIDPSATRLPGLPVALSEVELERVLANLLTNAVTHGRAPVLLRVDSPSAPAGWVRLSVADSGPGMSAELLATATDRFTRSAQARSLPGSGLGLALVKAIVHQAGGELRLCHGTDHTSVGRRAPVPCEPHPGMVVAVYLPLVESPEGSLHGQRGG
ncbi:ATP-binding protein [soil metagenome]